MYQNFNKIYRAAIYVRLSKEDGDLSHRPVAFLKDRIDVSLHGTDKRKNCHHGSAEEAEIEEIFYCTDYIFHISKVFVRVERFTVAQI